MIKRSISTKYIPSVPESLASPIIDPENPEEIARLLQRHRLFLPIIEDEFADLPGLSTARYVLDLACGPGAWDVDVAHAYPDLDVIGIDSSGSMVAYARARASVRSLSNALFQVVPALRDPLPFADGTFDLINARFLLGTVPTKAWEPLLQECRRILRPGGLLCLMEADTFSCANGSAFNEMDRLVAQALWISGYAFSAIGVGITPMLIPLLRTAGYQSLQTKVFAVECTSTDVLSEGFSQYLLWSYALLEPFLLDTQMISKEAWGRLYRQVEAEMAEETFSAIWYSFMAWGSVPEDKDGAG